MSPYRNLEEYNIEITNEVREHFSKIIDDIGEDVDREGLTKTPERAAKAMLFLTQGYKQDAVEILQGAMFKEAYDDMKKKVMTEMERMFRPEFRNRLDGVMIFSALTKPEIKEIADYELADILARLADKHIGLSVTNEAKDFLAEEWSPPGIFLSVIFLSYFGTVAF